jgi:putative flippase GtrA
VQAKVINVDANGAPAAILIGMTMDVPPLTGWPQALLGERFRAVRFIGVGCVATAVHWCAVVGLVSGWQWCPLLANVLGWLIAFAVSFLGHHWMTFHDQGSTIGVAAPRFFMVSAAGFAINEAAYALALLSSPRHYQLWLLLVLAGVAGLTYVISRHWAFLRTDVIE